MESEFTPTLGRNAGGTLIAGPAKDAAESPQKTAMTVAWEHSRASLLHAADMVSCRDGKQRKCL